MIFTKTIRGVEVEVHAVHFVEDPSVGINLGPDEIWAVGADGKDFELTDEELEILGNEATEIYLSQENF